MWFCFNNAFISAVEHHQDKGQLVVRARKREHLERLFPNVLIVETNKTDYRYRVFVSKTELATLVSKAIMEDINYTNFKDSVKDKDLKETYGEFWVAALRMQTGKSWWQSLYDMHGDDDEDTHYSERNQVAKNHRRRHYSR